MVQANRNYGVYGELSNKEQALVIASWQYYATVLWHPSFAGFLRYKFQSVQYWHFNSNEHSQIFWHKRSWVLQVWNHFMGEALVTVKASTVKQHLLVLCGQCYYVDGLRPTKREGVNEDCNGLVWEPNFFAWWSDARIIENEYFTEKNSNENAIG